MQKIPLPISKDFLADLHETGWMCVHTELITVTWQVTVVWW